MVCRENKHNDLRTVAISYSGKDNRTIDTFVRCETEPEATEYCRKRNLEENAVDLLTVCEDLLHQISTDSDLETITGAKEYKALENRLRIIIANATGN